MKNNLLALFIGSVTLLVVSFSSVIACLRNEHFSWFVAGLTIVAAVFTIMIFITEYINRPQHSFIYFEAVSFDEAMNRLRKEVLVTDETELRVRRAFSLQIGDLLGFSINRGFLKID